jgi:hypothetical protein
VSKWIISWRGEERRKRKGWDGMGERDEYDEKNPRKLS